MLAFSGIGLIAHGLSVDRSNHNASTESTPMTSQPAAAPDTSSATTSAALAYSEPRSISIPAINVTSEVLQVGKNAEGTMEVPLGDNVNKTAWYKHSPTPGQVGASIIVGHLNQPDGSPSIFAELHVLNPSDIITVAREDGSQVQFEVTATKEFAKEDFPTLLVYGPSEEPTLRLITCSGVYDRSIDNFNRNTVVYAKMKE